MLKPYITKVINGQDLSAKEAKEAMDIIMTGQATQAQIGGYLVALRMKGETVEEIAGSARTMREQAARVPVMLAEGEPLLDTAGTGGDGSHSFNISTGTIVEVIAGFNGGGNPGSFYRFIPEIVGGESIVLDKENFGNTERWELVTPDYDLNTPPGPVTLYNGDIVKTTDDIGVKPRQLANLELKNIDDKKYVEYLKTTFDQVLDALGISFNDILGISKLESFWSP